MARPSPYSSRRTSTIAGAAVSIAVITLVARVVGFGRWIEFSRSVGATCVGTVYQSANTIPNVLFEVVAGGALAAVVVPLLASRVRSGRTLEADGVASALMTWAILLTVPMAVGVWLLAGPIAAATVGSLCSGAQETAVQMLRIFAPQIVLYGIGAVLIGVLHAHRRFLAVALAPLASSLVVIATYAAYATMPGGPGATRFLAWGTTAGVAVLSLPLLWPTYRVGVRLRPRLSFPGGEARRARSLAVAGLATVAATQFAVLATVLVSNRVGVGYLTVYAYVQAVYMLPFAALAVPLATASFPVLAQGPTDTRPGRGGAIPVAPTPSAYDVTPLEIVLQRTLALMTYVGWGSAGVLAAMASPIGSVFQVLDAGSATAPGSLALSLIPTAVFAYAPGLVGLCLLALCTRALLARHATRAAAVAGAVGWLIAAVVPLLSITATTAPRRAIIILGASSSVGMAVGALIALLAIRRVWGRQVVAGLPRRVLVGAVGALFSAGLGILVNSERQPIGIRGSIAAAVVIGIAGSTLVFVTIAIADRPMARRLVRRLTALWSPGQGA